MAKTCKQFCKTYEKQYLTFQKNLIAVLSKDLKTKDKKKIKDKIMKNMDKKKNKIIKLIARECNLKFCNKTCKNTIFESGRNKYPPVDKELAKDPKLKKHFLQLKKTTKKRLFGNKDNILKNDFYEKLTPVKVKKLQKEGAISGCVEDLPLFLN